MADLYRPDEEIRVHPDNRVQRRSFLEAGMMVVIAGIIPKSLRGKLTPEEALQVWTTADGREVRICDMTDDHLRNCIFYMNKYLGYVYPHRIMGGVASEHFPHYDAMRREATRRNLRWI